MDYKKIAVICIFVLVAGAAISIVLGMRDRLVNKSDEIVIEDNSYRNIDILSDNASVEIVPIKSQETKVEIKGKMKKKSNYNFHVNVVGDTLQVEFTEKRWNFIQIGFLSKDIKLTVHVPKKEYSQLKAELDNGRIIATNIQVKDVDVETDNGSIELKNIDAKNVQASSDNGQIILKNVEGTLQGETDNGRIKVITKKMEKSIDLKTDNGLIEIQTEKEPTNATIEANVNLGKVDIFGKNKSQTVFGDGDILIKLKTDNGKILVEKSK